MATTSGSASGFSLLDAERQQWLGRVPAVATRDPHVIRQWAARVHAEPATGESTATGPATPRHVNDDGAGIRFNFPGAAMFRPISWDEWFDHFRRNQLTFLYEEGVADRAYALWEARGGGHGRALDDWLAAERQVGPDRGVPSARYGLVRDDRLEPAAGS